MPQLPNINTNNVITITDPPFNAAGDGVTDNTLAISNAIVQASQGGNTNNLYGGTVRIPAPGVFVSGPLTLRNNVNVQIDAGATLQMLPLNLFTNYPAQNQTFGNLFYASGLTNLEISGSGTIDGQGSNWWSAPGSVFNNRPYMIFFNGNCGQVLIQNVTLRNPPKMHIVFKGSDNNITVQGIIINTTATNAANTDGIDLVGANCLVQGCVINAGDDNIALGSSSASAISSDIVITNCAFGKGHGVSIGSNTAGGVSNLTVINCTFDGTDYGIRMKSNDATSGGSGEGGIAQNLNYYNLGMTNIVHGAIVIYSYYGSSGQFGTPTSVSPYFASTQAVDVTTIPVWRDITISNVTATVANGGVPGIIWARMEVPATNLVFNHVNISGPQPFDVYSAKGVQFIDCQITPPAGSNTFLIYNAQVTISNSSPSANLVTFDGLSTNGYGSSLSLYNAQASFSNTNVFDTGLLTLGGGSLTVSNHLNLGASSVVNFILGTGASTLNIKSNLAVSGTVNLGAGAGFTNNTYTLFTYGGNLSWGPPTLMETPSGFYCAFDTNTPGQVKAVITAPVTWTVSSLNNIGTGSLRQQVASAHSGDTIVFSNGLTGTVPLSSGEIVLSNSISILGPGAGRLAVSGTGVSRVFEVASGSSLLAGLCITNGKPSSGDGGGIMVDSGAGLVLSNCLVVGNSTAGNGGGLINQGMLTVWNSFITNNASTLGGHGGGLYNQYGTSVLWNCTISGNKVNIGESPYDGGGGGIDNRYGACIFVNCTIYSNTVANASPTGVEYGGGIYNEPPEAAIRVMLTNCTVASNYLITNVLNHAQSFGGGIWGNITYVAGSIIANNIAGNGPDVGDYFVSGGYNLIGKSDGSIGFSNGVMHDLVGSIASPINPLLGPLQNNGGPTPTVALSTNSPAIDQGNSFGLTTDQRGAPRPFDYPSIANAGGGDGSDIGAFESSNPTFQVGQSGNNIILSWPSYYGGVTVQTSTNLTSSNNWVSFPGASNLVGNQLIITNGISSGIQFYRLKGN
ncbi:MAG: glycosyl hydrolase family 28 protein [Limisphaerales bacterium]